MYENLKIVSLRNCGGKKLYFKREWEKINYQQIEKKRGKESERDRSRIAALAGAYCILCIHVRRIT